MLVALDLLGYWLQLGRHSISHLIKHQLIPLSLETVDLIKAEARPGDVILTRSMRGLSSWVILYATNSPVNHAISVGSDGRCYEAVPGGIRAFSLEEICDGSRFGVLLRYMQHDSIDLSAMDSFLQSKVGAPYSYAGALRVGIKCLFGSSPRYHPRTTIDFVLMNALVLFLSRSSPMLFGFVAGIGTSMVIVVFLNILMSWVAKESDNLLYMRPDDITPGDFYMDAIKRRSFRFAIPVVDGRGLIDIVKSDDKEASSSK